MYMYIHVQFLLCTVELVSHLAVRLGVKQGLTSTLSVYHSCLVKPYTNKFVNIHLFLVPHTISLLWGALSPFLHSTPGELEAVQQIPITKRISKVCK